MHFHITKIKKNIMKTSSRKKHLHNLLNLKTQLIDGFEVPEFFQVLP